LNRGAYYNESNRYCAAWLRNLIRARLIAPGVVDVRDVRDVRPADLDGYRQVHLFAGIGLWSCALRMAGWSDDRAVWTASCPCQPFSQAGGGAGVFDDRHLWPAAFWLISQHTPRTVFGEQVASPDGVEWLDIVSDDLGACGYACGPVDLPVAGVGGPNIRQRLFWVADADGGRWGQQRIKELAGQQSAPRSEPDGCSTPGGLGDTERARLPDTEPQDLCGAGRRCERRAVAEPSGTLGPWRELEWIYCRDGRRRPTQPGIQPLAARRPGDVAKLRAYGNAVSPIAAAAVIRAWMTL
jgi:DNA (cytosine-5)-methyltransferase 1